MKPPMQIYSVKNKPAIRDYYAPDTEIVRVEIRVKGRTR